MAEDIRLGDIFGANSSFVNDMFFRKFFQKNASTADNAMKYLIVGLGNMGAEYDDTRHNVGFAVVDYIAAESGATFKNDSHGDIAIVKNKGRSYYLLKPSTYMNLSGKAVRYWLQKLAIKTENILIITDDLNLEFGFVRIRKKGSDGGHNGLKSIQELLNTIDYNRMRIGIGNNFSKGRQVNYVLGKWTETESTQLPDLLKHASAAVFTFGALGIDEAMNKYNLKK